MRESPPAITRQLAAARPAPVRREDLSIFTFETMMKNYLALYRRLLGLQRSCAGA